MEAKCSLAIIWQNCENWGKKVWKLTFTFLNTETLVACRTVRKEISVCEGLNLDLELL